MMDMDIGGAMAQGSFADAVLRRRLAARRRRRDGDGTAGRGRGAEGRGGAGEDGMTWTQAWSPPFGCILDGKQGKESMLAAASAVL
jgi:hypothetical protein